MLSTFPLDALSASYPYPFPPPPTAKRANTLLLKHRIADLLTREQGEAYWSLLCRLLTAKITKEEFDLGWQTHFGVSPSRKQELATGAARDLDVDALQYLHNALLLSILYNTTRPTLPPSNVSNQGWQNKRKRPLGAAGNTDEAADPLGEHAAKRRKVKQLLSGMTKAEKKRLKVLLGNKKEKLDAGGGVLGNASGQHAKVAHLAGLLGGNGTLLHTAEKSRTGLAPGTNPLRPHLSAEILPDLHRVSAYRTMSETRELPDVYGMHDRMTALAYTSGLSGGAEGQAAALAQVALQIYLKNILSHLVSLSGAASAAQSQPSPISQESPSVISRGHVSAVLDQIPSLMHAQHLGSIQRFQSHQHLHGLPPRQLIVNQWELRQTATLAIPDKGSDGASPAVLAPRPVPASTTKSLPNEDEGGAGDSLEAELFPEHASSATSSIKPVQTDSSAQQATEPEAVQKRKPPRIVELDDGSSSDEELAAVRAQTNGQRSIGNAIGSGGPGARYGLWKMLSGMLEKREVGWMRENAVLPGRA